MRTAYRVLASLIALEVAIQAAVMVYAIAGLGRWVGEDGGVLDQSSFGAGESLFPEFVGLIIHGMNGMMIIPALALIFFVVSFFAKIPKGVAAAGIVLGLVVLQVALGIGGHSLPILGLLHGLNALALFASALHAARLARTPSTTPATRSTAGAMS